MTIMPTIVIQPVLFELGQHTISTLKESLSEELNASSIVTLSSIKEIPVQLFDKQRKQWNSSTILQWLSDMFKPSSKSARLLFICDFDSYSDELNFVFGEAYVDGNVSAIYLPRLRQEFYGLKPDESFFYQRLVKEAVHELGHAFGLNHCESIKCVMHFSNSLSDTDIKTSHLCNVCRGHLV